MDASHLKERSLSAEIKQPLIKKEPPINRGGSSDGYGIKVPKRDRPRSSQTP